MEIGEGMPAKETCKPRQNAQGPILPCTMLDSDSLSCNIVTPEENESICTAECYTNTDVESSRYCEHLRRKNRCVLCNAGGGAEICQHSRRYKECSKCDPENCYAGKYRKCLKRALREDSSLAEQHCRHLHLSYSFKCFQMHMQSKMDAYNVTLQDIPCSPHMTFENTAIDHIKPVFMCIRDGDDRNTINHYTNIQPLFLLDNLQKSHFWSSDDEIYWRNNIIFKPDFTAIYMPFIEKTRPPPPMRHKVL